MVFAEMDYQWEYQDFHAELVAFLSARFSRVESGLQGDSYIWIFDDDEKVRIDTFSSMKHQIKSRSECSLVQNVLDTLLREYKVLVFKEPQLEGNEDFADTAGFSGPGFSGQPKN